MCMAFSQLKPYLDECFNLQSRFADYQNQISTLLEFCNGISNGIVHGSCVVTCISIRHCRSS